MTSSGDKIELQEQQWRIIDAIGPFMRENDQKCINWSKIIFSSLQLAVNLTKQSGISEGEASEQEEVFWERVEHDMLIFIRSVKDLGYNTVTLDDVAHLTFVDNYEPEVQEFLQALQPRMASVLELIKNEGMKILVTTDIVPLTKKLQSEFGRNSKQTEDWFCYLLKRFLQQHPCVEGVILRLGEGDGKDVRELFKSELFLKSASKANTLIKRLLPMFEESGKTLVCRNWTVGAHSIGDLIWHRNTYQKFLEGIDSKHFIFSLKYGESDFFRYLPLNTLFFSSDVQKVVEFQARREYEGAGEFPSFVGFDVEAYAKLLSSAKNLVGFSVWCQTGGWHAFRRLAFIDEDALWIEQNVAVIAAIFGEGLTVQEWIGAAYPDDFQHAEFFFSLNDRAIKKGIYISEFARQKWFFRRTRIPPLLHVYWDNIIINHPVRKMMRHFVSKPAEMLEEAEEAIHHVRKLHEVAKRLEWLPDDLEFMFDTFKLFALAKQYCIGEFNDELKDEVVLAKKAYKKKYPRSKRQRYRVKVDFQHFRFSLRRLKLVSSFLLRRKRRYRMLDHLFTLHLLRYLYRIFKKRNEKNIPDFVKDSAMGIDVLFE